MRLALEGQTNGLETGRDQPDDHSDLNRPKAVSDIVLEGNLCSGNEAYRNTPLRRQTTQIAHLGGIASRIIQNNRGGRIGAICAILRGGMRSNKNMETVVGRRREVSGRKDEGSSCGRAGRVTSSDQQIRSAATYVSFPFLALSLFSGHSSLIHPPLTPPRP